jgi:hypothetical protein
MVVPLAVLSGGCHGWFEDGVGREPESVFASFHVDGCESFAEGIFKNDFSFAVHASAVEKFVDVGGVFHVAVRG